MRTVKDDRHRTKDWTDVNLAAYRYYAPRAIENWAGLRKKPSQCLQQFARVLPKGGVLFDYGCGIGTDLAWLKTKGFRVAGMDGTADFVEEARRRNPGVSIAHSRFDIFRLPAARYDGIWANATLMHIVPQAMDGQLKKLASALKPGGFLGVVLPWGRKKGIAQSDWIPGRYMACYTNPEAAGFFKGWNVNFLKTIANDHRSGRWIQILAQKK